MRTCVGCGRRRAQAELVRCALVDGAPVLGRAPGRGAYICGPECLVGARKRRGLLQRAWQAELPPDVFERLAELLDRN